MNNDNKHENRGGEVRIAEGQPHSPWQAPG